MVAGSLGAISMRNRNGGLRIHGRPGERLLFQTNFTNMGRCLIIYIYSLILHIHMYVYMYICMALL